MKRIVSVVLVIAIIMSLLSISAFAQTGDILGYAKYTDIVAYINHYPITSYNINGYTAIVVEDLRNYGFDVIWNGDNRTLMVERNSQTQIEGKSNVYKYSCVAGQNSFPYVETDIVTYVNGQVVTSYNIGGQTCIYIDSLGVYGGVEWCADIRAIKLGIIDLPVKEYAPIEEAQVTTLYAADGRTIVVNISEEEAYKSVGWFTDPVLAKYTYYQDIDAPTYDSVPGCYFVEKKASGNSSNYFRYSNSYHYNYTSEAFRELTDPYVEILKSMGWSFVEADIKKETRIVNGVIKQVVIGSVLTYGKDNKEIIIIKNYKYKTIMIHQRTEL